MRISIFSLKVTAGPDQRQFLSRKISIIFNNFFKVEGITDPIGPLVREERSWGECEAIHNKALALKQLVFSVLSTVQVDRM